MRIEKVNDTQIRCTLTKEDLAERQIKLSELAYGSEKAKDLFRDMMQQAAFEFGFEAENIPLMIEAIPLSTESIILIITKVEYPEELDTRFSQLSSSGTNEDILRGYFDSLVGKVTKRQVLDDNPVMSQRTVERLLQKMQAEGYIEKVGAARATCYRRVR